MAPTLSLRVSYGMRRLAPRRVVPSLRAYQLKDVAEKLKERQEVLKLTDVQSQQVVRDVLNIVQDILVNGEDVTLRGFGKFTCKDGGQKEFRNPKTGERFVKENSVRVSFQPSTALKRTLSENANKKGDTH